MRVTRCAVDVVASAAPNATIIAENLRREAQQIAQAFINSPNDVRIAISSFIFTVIEELEAISEQVERYVRYSPPS